MRVWELHVFLQADFPGKRCTVEYHFDTIEPSPKHAAIPLPDRDRQLSPVGMAPRQPCDVVYAQLLTLGPCSMLSHVSGDLGAESSCSM